MQVGAAMFHEKPGAVGALGRPSTQQKLQPLLLGLSLYFMRYKIENQPWEQRN